MRIAIAAAALFVLLAGCASAQTVEPEPTASPQSIALEQAATMIERAGAGEFFEPGADAMTATATHRGSGLICHFDPGAPGEIALFAPAVSGTEAGEDVSCTTVSSGSLISFFATRYHDGRTLDAAFNGAIHELTDSSPSARPFERTDGLSNDSDEPLPESLTAHFHLAQFRGIDGPAYTRVSMAQVRGWTIMMRTTGPDTPEAQAQADIAWATAMVELQRNR